MPPSLSCAVTLKADSPKKKKRLPLSQEALGIETRISLRLLLERGASVLPAGDAGGEVLHVGVAELLGRRGRRSVGAAGGAAAVGDDERALVGWQVLGDLRLGRAE